MKKLPPAEIFRWLNGNKEFKRLPLKLPATVPAFKKVRKVKRKRVHERKKHLHLADDFTSESPGISRSGRTVKTPKRFIEEADSESEDDPIEKKRKLFQSLLQSSDSDTGTTITK